MLKLKFSAPVGGGDADIETQDDEWVEDPEYADKVCIRQVFTLQSY